jgi:excisionase family DNA binding protein
MATDIDEEATTGIFLPDLRLARPPAEPIPSDDVLWDVADVARYLRVSRSWVYHRAEAGGFPLRRVGGLLRFDPAAVKAFARGEAVRGASARRASTTRRP